MENNPATLSKTYFPSLEMLLTALLRVIRRFPLEILFALAGTWAAIQASVSDKELTETFWGNMVMCCLLGLVYSISASTWVASLRTRNFVIWLLRALILGLAVLYFYTLPDDLRQEEIYRFFLLAAAGHVLVSVAPFWERGNISRFWFYNKTLFLRFLTAALYSAVLFAGLSVALVALDELFGVTIKGEVYFRLWIVIAGVFNTILFLAGVPVRPLEGDKEETYPKALKIFTQYVLIPLVSIYVLILLAYELKILVQWELPRGWVSNLIIAFAVFGVLSLLLVFPVRHSSENKWISWYGKTFHWILLPLVVLLFLAIGKRISDYGFTEERFIVLVTGIWLLYTALYFLSGRRENIKMIPASLIVAILVTVTLAFPVSVYSQKQRLFAVFERNNMLGPGNPAESGEAGGNGENNEAAPGNDTRRTDALRVIPAKEHPSIQDRQEITSIVNYLYRMHGTEPFEGHFEKLPEEHPDQLHRYRFNFTDSLLSIVRVDPAYSWSNDPGSGDNRNFNISVNPGAAIPTAGYDYHLSMERYSGMAEYRAGGHVITEKLRPKKMTATLIIDERDTLRLNLEPLFSKLMQEYIERGTGELTVTPEEAYLERETDRYKVRLYLLRLWGEASEKGVIDTISQLHAETGYLLKFKKKP